MTREQILRDRLRQVSNNLYHCSTNYLMTIPKAGYEEEHKRAAAEVELLQTWLKEFPPCRLDGYTEFIGILNANSWCRTGDGKSRADTLSFTVDIGKDSYRDGDYRVFYVGQEARDWFVGVGGTDNGCGRYDLEKERRQSRVMKLMVDRVGYVRAIEWLVAEPTDAAN